MSAEMKKYIIVVDDEEFEVDEFGYEPTQLDSDASGRMDDFSMQRDVGGLTNKLYAKFNALDKWYGRNLSKLIKLIDLTECTLRFFSAKEYSWVEKRMYITISKISYTIIDDETYLSSPVELHFIQMDVDEVVR